jgi:CRP-like cAMP-binding protein
MDLRRDGALLEHARRRATVVTLEETELAEIDEAQFYLFVRQNPHVALQLVPLLSERLRRPDALYRNARVKELSPCAGIAC